MEIESELFIPNLKNPKLIALVSEKIGRISNGSSSHCAGALTLGLEKAVLLKKQRKGVLLRCPRNGCARNKDPVSFSSVGPGLYCLSCVNVYGSYYMLCAGCGNARTANYSACQRCGKKFV